MEPNFYFLFLKSRMPSSLTRRILFQVCQKYSVWDAMSLIFNRNLIWQKKVWGKLCHLDPNGTCILCNSFKRSYPNALLLTTVDISEILFRYSYTFNAQHICSKYRWVCLPVFRPNIGKISVAAFWAAIGRAALLLAEAACPPVPGISTNHWPSWSHSWLI